MGVKLPTDLPFSLGSYKSGIQLPIKLPFRIGKINTDDIWYKKSIQLKEIPIDKKEKEVFLKVTQIPIGGYSSLPISETVWNFNGLIVSENIIGSKHGSLLVNEKLYSQILVDFELLNENQLQIKWSGTRVPRVQIYIKSLEQEDYQLYNSYSWNRGQAIIPIQNQNYYIKIVGLNESGSSDEYLVNSALISEIESDLNMVSSTEKIYNIDISYTSEYKIEVEY